MVEYTQQPARPTRGQDLPASLLVCHDPSFLACFLCVQGVNGVGKSTNLAKVCYYLKHVCTFKHTHIQTRRTHGVTDCIFGVCRRAG